MNRFVINCRSMKANDNSVLIPKVRNSNLELYRIIVMLSIVAHHYVVNSGLMTLMDADPLNPKSIFLYMVGMWGKTGINCFVLITGYFMCKSEITLRKFLKLLLEIEFYNIVIHLIFVASGYIDFSPSAFLWLLFPIHNISGGFIDCYMVFFLFIPFLNVLIRHLNRSQHITLIMLCVGIYSLFNWLPGVEVGSNDSIWFCILYIISSFLRLYPIKRNGHVTYWMWMTVFSVLLAMFSVFALIHLARYGIHLGAYAAIGWPSAPLALLVSICAFMCFKDLNIKQSKLINVIGGGTFGVLLIHANSDTMRHWLWCDVCNNVGQYVGNSIYLHAILVPLAVFTICSVIEFVRMKTIEKRLLDFTYNTVCKYFPNVK